MPGRKSALVALLAKNEATYGVDAVPTGALNAMVAHDFDPTPLGGEEVEDEDNLPYFGHQGAALVGDFVQIDFGIRMGGSGTAGVAPAYGPLLRSAGLAEVVTATTKTDYTPVSSGIESVTAYLNQDGALHKLLGGFSNIVFEWNAKQRPRLRVSTRGLYSPVTAAALPTVDRTKFKKAIVCSKTNTPTVTLHGVSIVAQSISIDLGNMIDKTDWVNDEEFDVTNRKIKGTIVAKAQDIATKDWFAAAKAETLGPLQVTHGVTAGSIVEASAANVQVLRPKPGNNNGILTYSIPFVCTAQSAGGDFKFTAR